MPALLVLAALVLAAAGRAAAGPPELSDFPVGSQYVDWSGGAILAYGSGEPGEEDVRLAAAYQTSKGAAFSQARSRLAAAAAAARFSSAESVASALEKSAGGRAARRFRSLLQEARPLLVFLRRDGSAGVWITVPLYASDGLGGVFGGSGDEQTAESLGLSGGGSALSLLVDVSDRIVKPCLWPKITDSDGQVLLDLPGLAAAGSLPAGFSIVRTAEEAAAGEAERSGGAAAPRLPAALHANGSDIVVNGEEWKRALEDAGPLAALVLVEQSAAGNDGSPQTLP